MVYRGSYIPVYSGQGSNECLNRKAKIKMTVHTNLEDYDDPVLYDIENERFGPPDEFFLKLAQRIGGTVLELGCGTGKYTIPIAQHGISITGLDIVPPMLEQAKSK